MIHRVEIDNFALVEHAELDLEPGLTVLSGETGAGKSIVIDALDFASGGRADRAMLRAGAQEASVTLLLDERPGEERVVGRTLRDGGRSYARIDGQLVTAGGLKDLMEPLLAIHSQNDQQTIFRESVHQALLDAYAGERVSSLLADWRSLREDLLAVESRLAELHLDPETRNRRRDILAYQVDEILRADLSEGEEEALLKKIKTLSAVRELVALMSRATGELAGIEGHSINDRLGRVVADLTEAGRFSSRLRELSERAVELKAGLVDLTYDLERAAERLEEQPQALEEANRRLELIRRLEEKYGRTLEDVAAYGERAAM